MPTSAHAPAASTPRATRSVPVRRRASSPLPGRALLLAALAASPAAAVQGALAADPAPEEAPTTAEEEAVRDEVVGLIEARDYERARERIDDLLLERDLDAARHLLAAGAPADALLAIDRALLRSPRDSEVLWLKAEGSLQLAEQGIARDAGALLIQGALEDALAHYALSARDDPRATFGACRAAYLLGDVEEAVRWAREGADALLDEPALAEGSTPPPHRTVAEALFRAYVEAKGAEEPDEPEVAARFAEAEEALARLLGRRSDSGWAWSTLADLYEWEDRTDLARARLLDGIARQPGHAGLLRRLARVVRKEDGRTGVIETFARFASRNPSIALGHWLLAVERFDAGLDAMNPPEGIAQYDPTLFELAEAGFRRCRELSPADTNACLGYEVVCRGARGWCAYYRDDLETARQEFLSMNDLFDGGITWSIDGRLRSGVLGLAFVGDQHQNRGELLAAGEAFELALRFEPEEPAWANNAGFFLRDAGVDLERVGRRLCRAAHGKVTGEDALAELRALAEVPAERVGTPEERVRFAAAANERFVRARDAMERSWRAYEQAARLDRQDVRTVNDAALVLVYYLHEHLDEAERLLLHAAEIGVPQLEALRAKAADPDLSDAEHNELEGELYVFEEAVGDVFQNLGVLAWVHDGDAERALPWLQRAVEIGPDPRPMLTNNLMPVVRGEREMAEGEYFDLLGWARPCELVVEAAAPAGNRAVE